MAASPVHYNQTMERLPALDSPTSRFVSTKAGESSSSKSTTVGGGGAGGAGSVGGDGRPSSSSMDRHTPLPPIRTSPERGGPDERLRLSTRKEDWPRIPMNGQGSHENLSGSHRYHQPHTSYYDEHTPGSGGSYKRKRSEESIDDGPRRSPGERAQLPYEPASDGRPLEHRPYGRAPSPRRDTYPPPPPSIYPPLTGEGRQNPSSREESWYGQQSQASRPPHEPPQSASAGHSSILDAQLAEALQRETQNLDSNQGTSTGGSPDDDEPNGQPHRESDYGADRTPTSGVQVDHRRRKRVFSNRTKTGCLTCRRRKKKCDEQKPDCNNCIRGGFVCEGYSSRIEWQNKTREKAPVPLQAKDGDQASNHYNPQSPLPPGVRQTSLGGPPPGGEGSPPGYQQQPPKQISQDAQGASTRPILIEDDRDRDRDRDLERPRITTTLEGKPHGPAPYQKNIWPTPNMPHVTEHSNLRPEPPRIPPLHERGRPGEMDTITPPSTLGHVYPPQIHAHQPQPNYKADAQAQAQRALQHQAALRSMARTEKERMLIGEPYRPNDPELVYERERCKAALWRFNSSMNPNLGISRDERARLFRDILQPRDGPPSSNNPSSNPIPVGRVGANVVVEAPFNCDYGYNITVEQDVHIGLNCTVMDTCAVTIGPRTVIGPNVSILTATMSVEPHSRNGAQGPLRGRPITIQEDCWIGAGVIILPGLHIGRGATVGAGSVVTRNVPGGTVVAGNPARVLRVLPDSDDEGLTGTVEGPHSSPPSA